MRAAKRFPIGHIRKSLPFICPTRRRSPIAPPRVHFNDRIDIAMKEDQK